MWLSRELEADVYLKLECLHQSSSFKLRGATNYLLAYKETHGKFMARVVTASGGNHGLAVALACSRFHVPCLVVLPHNSAKASIIDALRGFGATVEVHGEAFNDASDYVQALADSDPTVVFMHPFADRWIREGAGTLWLEIRDQLRAIAELEAGGEVEAAAALPDIIVESVGGGGLLSGTIACLTSDPTPGTDAVQIAAVETEGTEWCNRSVRAGSLVTLDAISSIATTLGAKTTTEEVWNIVKDKVQYPMVVSDRDTVHAAWAFLQHEKLLIEPATSCNVAAVLQHKEDFKGKKVVMVICGSGTTVEDVQRWMKEL